MAKEEKEAQSARESAAVYVPWASFKSAIEQLVEGIPNRIDRTVFPGQAWGVQSQLISGLKFLELIDEDGKPMPLLHALAVPDEATRKEQLKKIIQKRYSALFALDLLKTTPAELGEKMSETYRVTGDTREKAIRFFLAAVTYLNIPVSSLLAKVKTTGNGSGGKKRSKKASVVQAPPANPMQRNETTGTSRSIKLVSGGTLTVTATVDFFALSPADRKFVFEVIEKLETYEQPGAAETA